jgi:2-polyprenyl-6-methoxyphenol hydroxylase-like FAD-dependent oxidoreductase
VRVLIVGAGIGGATAALSLHAAGITDVTLLESVSEIRPLGVGINVLPHAVRELTELGLGEQLAATGVATADLTYVNRQGQKIWNEPRGVAAGYNYPQYSIHRGRLQMLLLDAVKERLGAGAIRTGCRVVSSATNGDLAELTYQRGDERITETADLIIAADGIKSAIRAEWFPDEGPPVWNGLILWRAVSRAKPFLSGKSMVMAGDREIRFVVYPIEDVAEDGTQLINWVAEKDLSGADGSNFDWNKSIDRSVFAPAFADWNYEWLDIPALIESAEAVYEYPMVDRPPLESWIRGRVVLLGDAAHPTYPVGSNGSSQAIIDTRVLAHALATMPIEDALAFYENERLPKTRELQKLNRAMGPERVLQMVRERSPEGFEDIHDVISQAELEEVASNYKRVAGFDPSILNNQPSWSVEAAASSSP